MPSVPGNGLRGMRERPDLYAGTVTCGSTSKGRAGEVLDLVATSSRVVGGNARVALRRIGRLAQAHFSAASAANRRCQAVVNDVRFSGALPRRMSIL